MKHVPLGHGNDIMPDIAYAIAFRIKLMGDARRAIMPK